MIQTIDISLIPSENKPVINVSQFDNISRVLRFNVFDDFEMEVPHVFDNTETVLLNIRKNDNNIVVITGVIVSDIDPETQEVTGQYITFELTEQACACVGSNYGEVSITNGSDEVIGSCNFKLIVERSPLAGGVSSQTAIDNLTTQIEQITEEVVGENYYNKEEVNVLIDTLEDSIPTKTSELENDSGFITAEDVPTKTSELENDSGFTTIDDNATANDKTWSSDKISDELYDLLPVGISSGPIASFNTALAKPLLSCVVDENATKLYQLTNQYFDYFKGLLAGSHNFVALGSLNWTYYGSSQVFRTSGLKVTSSNLICNGYTTQKPYISWGLLNDLDIQSNDADTIIKDTRYNDAAVFKNALDSNNIYAIYELDNPITPTITQEQFITLCNAFDIDYNIFDLPLTVMPTTYAGDNNFFTDYGDITVQYNDTIQNYIDTRVNTVSNRSLSIQRTLETLEKSVTLDKTSELERGDNNDDNAR